MLVWLVACSDPPAIPHRDAPSLQAPTSAPSPDPEPEIPPVEAGDPATLAVPTTGSVNNGRFATSEVCAECHSSAPGSPELRDAAGRPVGMYDLWQSTMMANAARDPVWRAAVSAEVAATPGAGAEIEAKCTRCHAPMASQDALLLGDAPLDLSVVTSATERGDLARDGVSCTLCHQMSREGLGTEESFSGGFVIPGDGVVYGPHASPFGHPMETMTGFTPEQSQHVLDSELCATCHVLRGHTLGEDGLPTGGEVLEQATFLEWKNSASYEAGQSCQSCHVPAFDVDGVLIETEIARMNMPGPMANIDPRSPFGRHLFVGGNVWTPVLLRDNPDLFRPAASPAAFDATLAAARAQLEQSSASVRLEGVARAGGVLQGTVIVIPQVGHKLPTGIPVRRAWLHVTVTDAAGATLWESGGWDTSGRILGAGGSPRPEELASGPVFPHLSALDDAADVVVYESILADSQGQPTFRLTRAAGFYKDTRLLPAGWDPTSPDIEGAEPVGVASDPDFVGGEDRVTLAVPLEGDGPLTVTAELLYQPLSARWVDELVQTWTPEALGFLALWETLDRSPVVLGAAAAEAL